MVCVCPESALISCLSLFSVLQMKRNVWDIQKFMELYIVADHSMVSLYRAT